MTRLADWAAQSERGGTALVNVLVRVALLLGVRISRVLLPPLVLWFLLTSRMGRRGSRDYLGRVFGRPARLHEVARHFHCFGAAVLDRVFLVSGRLAGFHVTTEGLEHVAGIVARGRGCVLLGAHLGSFEVLRTLAAESPVPVRALMFRHNAGALTRLLEHLNPELRDTVIDIGDSAGMLQVKEAIDRGEIVGILADRTPDTGRQEDRQVVVPFLGAPARFPAGPFVLAAALGAPVVLFHGVRTGAQRYAIRFTPFADRVVLRRATRQADLAMVVTQYATALEQGCRAHPFNWFNFFAFWETSDDAKCDKDRRSSPADGGRLRRGAAPPANA